MVGPTRTLHFVSPPETISLRLLLQPRLLHLQRLLAITLDHNHAQKAAYHRARKQDQDHWDPDGPDSRREELLDWLVWVDEWLEEGRVRSSSWSWGKSKSRTIRRVQTE